MGFFDGFGLSDALGFGLGLASFGEQGDVNDQMQDNFEANLAFQRQTAKKAHQWEVKDLRKAGLNPILSATGGRGAVASGGSALPQINNRVANALQMKRVVAETENIQADAEKKRNESALIQEQTEKTGAETVQLKYKQKSRIDAQLKKLWAEERDLTAGKDLKDVQADKVGTENKIMHQITLPHGALKIQETLYVLEELGMKFKFLRGEHGQQIIDLEQVGRAGTAASIGLGLGTGISIAVGGLIAKIAKVATRGKVAKQINDKLSELIKNAPPSVRKQISKFMTMRELKKILGD